MTFEETKKKAKKMLDYYYTEVNREEEKFEYERGHISEDDVIDIIQEFLNYIENESIPKEKIRNLLNEISKEKEWAMQRIITEEWFHLAENGAVAQELGYIEAKLKRLLGE